MPKTSCNIVNPKKLKQVHSVTPNLRHNLFLLESKITYHNKHLETEQLLNQTFSTKASQGKAIEISVLHIFYIIRKPFFCLSLN